MMTSARSRARYMAVFYLLLASAPLLAAVLTGSGPHLPIPMPNPGDPISVAPVYVDSGGTFTGTWSTPAHPDWHGTFTGTGPPPATNPGFTTIDFTGLINGALPVCTIFMLSDLDAGTGPNEVLTLKAFDASNSALSEWLDVPFAVTVGASATETPGWNWNPVTSTYTFDGSGVPGNPNIAAYLLNNQEIHSMEISVEDIGFSFRILAQENAYPVELESFRID